jgi:hypothetical protein
MLRMDEDLASLNTITDEIGVLNSSLSRWMNKLPQYRLIAKHDQVRFSLNAGRCSQLDDIGPELLGFVKDLRENGYAVLRKMIVVQACKMMASDSAFRSKSYAAQGWQRIIFPFVPAHTRHKCFLSLFHQQLSTSSKTLHAQRSALIFHTAIPTSS